MILGVLLFLPNLLEFSTVHSLLSGLESIFSEDNFLDSLCFPTRSKFNIMSFDKHTSCFSSSTKFLTELEESSFSNNLTHFLCLPSSSDMFSLTHSIDISFPSSLHNCTLLPCF